MDELNQVDLAFVIDTTGSMGEFIAAAQQHMISVLNALAHNPQFSLDLYVSVVEYRDHPPQDQSYSYRIHPFSKNFDDIQKTINELTPSGGGDPPECVYDGLVGACTIDWRPHSRRIAILIGDSPPHDIRARTESRYALYGDCTCGLALDEVTALIETTGLQLYTLALTNSVQTAFSALAQMCGGTSFTARQGPQAIQVLQDLLAAEQSELEFDRQVLLCWQQDSEHSIDRISESLSAGDGRVAKSLTRLARRRLLANG